MSKRFLSNGGRGTDPVPFPELQSTDRFEHLSPPGEGMFGDRVLPWRSASDPASGAEQSGAEQSAVAERSLQVVLSYLGFGSGNVEHALTDLLRKTLEGDQPATAGVQAVEAARLVALWVDAVELEVVRVGELERAAEGLERLGHDLFASRADSLRHPGLGDRQVKRAIGDLARAAEALGPRHAYLMVRPVVDGMLASPGLESAGGAMEPVAWSQLSNALIAAVEGGAGSPLGLALLEAGRASDAPEAVRLRDVVGAAIADGAQALFRRFEQVAEERSELERRAGLNVFGLAGVDADLEAERALLKIEDRSGIVEQYDRVAARVRRTVDDLRMASESAPDFTLEFGQGRLLELATAVVS